MRYPVPAWMWFIPFLWPFALAVTLVWLMTKWGFWLFFHFTLAVEVVFWATVPAPGGQALARIATAVVVSLSFVGHLMLYVRWRRGAQRRRFLRDVAQARYWQNVATEAENIPSERHQFLTRT
jgi:hypothetical protein